MPRLAVCLVVAVVLIVATDIAMPKPDGLHMRAVRTLMEEAQAGVVDPIVDVAAGPVVLRAAHGGTNMRITIRCTLDAPVVACSVDAIEAMPVGDEVATE